MIFSFVKWYVFGNFDYNKSIDCFDLFAHDLHLVCMFLSWCFILIFYILLSRRLQINNSDKLFTSLSNGPIINLLLSINLKLWGISYSSPEELVTDLCLIGMLNALHFSFSSGVQCISSLNSLIIFNYQMKVIVTSILYYNRYISLCAVSKIIYRMCCTSVYTSVMIMTFNFLKIFVVLTFLLLLNFLWHM